MIMERCSGLRATLLSIVALILVTGVYYIQLSFQNTPRLSIGPTSSTRFHAPKPNIWADIKSHEADEVYNFLSKKWVDLNITKTPKTASDNFIVGLEMLQPNKSQSLLYLFEEQPRPERWVKVLLAHNTDDIPQLSYYVVGPLPVSEETKVEPLKYPFTSGRNSVRNLRADIISVVDFALDLGGNISDITTELLGASVNRNNHLGDPNGLQALPQLTRLQDDSVIAWIQFFRPGMGSASRTLLPQGLYARVDIRKDSGPGQWEVDLWFYNGQLFENEDHLRSAMKDPNSGFLKTPANLDGPWTDTEDFDSHPDGRELPPPVSIQPLGPRYKLDKTERFVSWFGFEFYLTTTQATGVSFFDIRFKGQRVMYELSLQEALAHYAGDDPMAGSLEFLDTFFGMGINSYELIPGYDCPAYSDYLTTEFHRTGKTERHPNNICIFEFTADYLLSRHSAQYSVTASRNTFLTVRSVATVGNYDYTIDTTFSMDGTIEVKVRASGFIFAAFDASFKKKDEYGHRIHDALSSSLHDHVINFKADMDVAGTANNMARLAVEPTTISYPWDQPHIKERNTMHLVDYNVTHEAGLNWPKNSGEFYLVYSSDQKNAWGERKGYRIVSGTGVGNPPHLTVLNSTSLGNSARWAEKDIWVVRHKDNEPRGADPLNYIDGNHPLIDFSNIADAESLEDGEENDLVIYFNVGSHHVPHSGDVPNTLMHTSASSVMFIPHNFADRDPSRESVQGVRLQLKGTDSGGFAGFPDLDDSDDARDPGKSWPAGELRNREKARDGKTGYQRHVGANYFGTQYKKDVKVPLEALEPNLEKDYQSEEIKVCDLGWNGSAAGVYIP